MARLRLPSRWPRAVRIGIWTILGLLTVVVVLYIGLAAYLYTHRAEITKQVVAELESAIDGDVQIQSLEPSLLSEFPNISIALRGVSLRDSLYARHGRELARFEHVYAQISPFSLIGGGLVIRRVRMKGGAIDLFTDASGYSNGYLIRSRDSTPNGADKENAASFRRILLEDVRLTIQDVRKEKLFKLHLNRLALRSRRAGADRRLTIGINTDVQGLGFNLDRGSFLKEQHVEADLSILYNTANRRVQIQDQALDVEGEEITLDGLVDLGVDTPYMAITFTCDETKLKKAKLAVSENITRALASIDLKNPALVKVFLRTKILHRDLPYVRVEFSTKENVLRSPAGDFTDCSFTGVFDNEWIKGERRTDPNSYIFIRNFRGTYGDIPLRSDTIFIQNLVKPLLTARMRSSFPAAAVNKFTGGKTFHFSSGTADFDLHYRGSLSLIDTVVPDIRGTVNIRDAVAEYVPRGLVFRQVAAQLIFEGTSIRLPKIHLQTAGSSLDMSGEARNILAALHEGAAPATLTWSVRSPGIRLEEFQSFLGKRGGNKRATKPSIAGTNHVLAERLDVALARASAHVQATIASVSYKTFRAEAVTADISITEHDAHIHRASLRHAGGSITASGTANTAGAGTSFAVKTMVSGVNLPEIFRAFKNFGQTDLRAENIAGVVSFVADLRGRLSDGGDLVSQSMEGNLTLDVRNGALLHFAPLEKVGKYAFRRRNLSELRFDALTSVLHLRGDRIEIEPTEIRTSALQVNVLGTYGLTRGTDISIQVPLRNPAKDSADIAEGGEIERSQKGVVVHVRAQNPDGSGLKIGWDRGGKIFKGRAGGGGNSEGVQVSMNQPAEPNKKETRRERRLREKAEKNAAPGTE